MRTQQMKLFSIPVCAHALSAVVLILCNTQQPVRSNSYDQLKWGFIDRSGKMQIAPKLDEDPNGFTDKLCVVEHDGKAYIMNSRGKEIFQIKNETHPSLSVRFGGGSAVVPLLGEKLGILDSNGKTIFPATITHVHDYAEGFWHVDLVGGRSVFIDVYGKELILPGQCQAAAAFSEGLAAVRVGQKEGFVNAAGELVISPKFDHVEGFSDGVASVLIEGKYQGPREGWVGKKGVIDKSGKLLFELEYSGIGKFHGGLAMVWTRITPPRRHSYYSKNVQVGFIDKTGKLIFRIDQESKTGPAQVVGEFADNLCVATDTNGFYGYIDRSGQFVVKAQFESAESFSEGLALVKLDSKWGLIDKAGKFVVPPSFSQVQNLHKFSEGLLAVKVNELWGFIDSTGRMVIPPVFPRAHEFNDGLAAVADGVDRFAFERSCDTAFAIPPRLIGRIGRTGYANRNLSEARQVAAHLSCMEQEFSANASAKGESPRLSFLIPYLANLNECSAGLLGASIFSSAARPDLISEAHKICDYELSLVDASKQLTNHDAWNVLTALAYRYECMGEKVSADKLYKRAAKVNKKDCKNIWLGPDACVLPELDYFTRNGATIAKIPGIAEPVEKEAKAQSPQNNLSDAYNVYEKGFDKNRRFLIKRGELRN